MSGERFTEEQVQRYARHIILPNVGGAGQRKLLDASVLVIGAGGLGSPTAMYLAAAGVGKLGIVDFDAVDVSNLQRQILHTNADVGRSKVESALEHLRAINPTIEVVGHDSLLFSTNVFDVMQPYDVIVDGTDNFPVRYLVNDATQFTGKPLVYGSIYQFEGQATVFMPGQDAPCSGSGQLWSMRSPISRRGKDTAHATSAPGEICSTSGAPQPSRILKRPSG